MSEEQQAHHDPFGIRYTDLSDAKYLKEWLTDPGVSRWFPITGPAEIEDAVNRWISFSKYRCSLTATMDNVPVGLATLYLQPYRKLAHQCEFGIIVGGEHRNKGIGSQLIKNLIHLAKEQFHVELIHLQVYSENPAIRLYERMGFKEFGRQMAWIKELDGEYTGRVFMERFI